jgi:hypothetical protein
MIQKGIMILILMSLALVPAVSAADGTGWDAGDIFMFIRVNAINILALEFIAICVGLGRILWRGITR